MFIEIPMHRNLTSFMFYDVLSIVSRYTFETSLPLIIQRRHELSLEIKTICRLEQK